MTEQYVLIPLKNQFLTPQETLLVCKTGLHSLVYLKRPDDESYCGKIDGDAALRLQAEGVKKIRVEFVGPITGVGKGRGVA